MKQMHTPPALPTGAAQEPEGSSRSSAGGQATLPGREHNHSRAQQAKHTRAFRYAHGAVDALSVGAADVRPQRHAAEGLQPMGERTGRNTESTVFQPMSESRSRCTARSQ
jgi:hypothetical protein